MLTEDQRVDYYMGKNKIYNIQSFQRYDSKEKADCKRDIINVINWQDHLSTSDFDNDTGSKTAEGKGNIPLWENNKYNKKWFSFVWGDSLDL